MTSETADSGSGRSAEILERERRNRPDKGQEASMEFPYLEYPQPAGKRPLSRP
jgi:hypothetical protein